LNICRIFNHCSGAHRAAQSGGDLAQQIAYGTLEGGATGLLQEYLHQLEGVHIPRRYWRRCGSFFTLFKISLNLLQKEPGIFSDT